ncbi:hypothetical protein [Absidia glauca]|uniref:Uncharacterized protein n=1 Tax=Absidia glauca TaxID=4829 RepID=A0A163KBQ3_ABSGL|nr:hypothetical protein [Absidia glauca]
MNESNEESGLEQLFPKLNRHEPGTRHFMYRHTPFALQHPFNGGISTRKSETAGPVKPMLELPTFDIGCHNSLI